MSLQSAAIPNYAPTRQAVYIPADTIAVALVWLTMAISGIVYFEPAPFDAMAMMLIPLLPLLRVVRVTPSLVLFLGMWLVIIGCSMVAIFDAENTTKALKHQIITLYLAIAASVIAGFVAANPERHGRAVMSGYAMAALACAAAAIIGYKNLAPGAADLFTEFGRGRGTFKDPNVYGAFLVPAILYALHNMMTRPPIRALVSLAIVGFLMFGVLISYSRGAWANLALALSVFGYLTFVTAPTVRRQLGLIVLGFVAIGMMVGVLFVATQFQETGDFLRERASLTQDYDVGSGGRFAGQLKALDVVIENPFGIGAREFGFFYHSGDVHNVYLSMFLNSGWIGGALYLTIVVVTVLAGFIHALRDTPTRGLFIAVYAAFVGTAGEGIIIDSDHWRHFFMLLAITWGLMAGRHVSDRPILAETNSARHLSRRLKEIVALDRRDTLIEGVQADTAPVHATTGVKSRNRKHGLTPWDNAASRNRHCGDPTRQPNCYRSSGPRIALHLRSGRSRPALAARARSDISQRRKTARYHR